MRGVDRLGRGDLGLLHGLIAGNLQFAGFLFVGDTVRGGGLFLCDAPGLGRFLGGDLRGIQRGDLGDLALLGGLGGGDAIKRKLPVLCDAGLFDGFAGGDLGLVHGLVAGDFQRPDAFFLGDTGPRGFLGGGDLGLVENPLAFDLARAGVLIGGDAFGAQRLFAGDARGLGGLLAGDFGLFQNFLALDFQRPGFAIRGNAFGIHRLFLRDTQFFCGFAAGDLGLLHGEVAGNLAFLGGLFERDPVLGDHLFLRDTRAFDDLAGGDVGLVHDALAFDVLALGFTVLGDAGFGNGPFLCDARLFDGFLGGDLGGVGFLSGLDALGCKGLFLADARLFDRFMGGDLGLVHHLLALDFLLADVAFRGDAGLGDLVFVGDTRGFDGLARRERGLFGLLLALRAFAGKLGALLGAVEFDIAFLFQPGLFAFAFDVERLFLGFEIAGADADHRVLLDVIAQLAALFDRFDDTGQADGVKCVGRVEIFDIGLVDIGDGNAFQFQPVLVQPFLRGLQNAGNIGVPVFVQFLHRHFAGHGAQGADEFAFEQGVQAFRFQRAPAQGGGGEADGGFGLGNTHVEFGVHVNAHAILGDQRFVAFAGYAQLHRVHVDRGNVVDDRPHEGAAVDHHLFPKEPGAHEGDLLGGAAIEPVHHPVEDEDYDHGGDQPQDQLSDELPCHLSFLPSGALAPDLLEFRRLFCQRDLGRQTFHGRRAIEAMAIGGVLQHEFGVFRHGDGAAMDQDDGVRVDLERGGRPGIGQGRGLFQRDAGFGADGAAGCQAQMHDDDVGAGFGHGGGVVFGEYVRGCQHVFFGGHGDHVDLVVIAHSGFFEIGPEGAVDQAHGGKVLNAREPGGLYAVKELVHQAEGVGGADPGQNGGVPDHGQHFAGHFHHHAVGIAIGHQPGQRAAPGHTVPSGIVDHDQVNSAGLFAFGGQAGARAAADDRRAGIAHGAEPGHQFGTVEHGYSPAVLRRGAVWKVRNVCTIRAANSGSLILWGTRISWRVAFWFTVSSSAANSAASAWGSQKG